MAGDPQLKADETAANSLHVYFQAVQVLSELMLNDLQLEADDTAATSLHISHCKRASATCSKS